MYKQNDFDVPKMMPLVNKLMASIFLVEEIILTNGQSLIELSLIANLILTLNENGAISASNFRSFKVYSSQCGFEILPLNHLFSREDLGEFIKEEISKLLSHWYNLSKRNGAVLNNI
jgi:hypothetical protein